MNTTDLTLRPATMVDAQHLLEWRNDPATLRNSRNSNIVSYEEHKAWLSRVFASQDHLILIAECAGQLVGVVRAARMADGWELSWTVAPQARGRGIGSRIVKAFAARLDGRLVAVIRKSNIASARIAAGAGLTLKGDAAAADFECWTRE